MKNKNLSFLLVLTPLLCHSEENKSDTKRPNILWIIAEDQSSHYGFQGERLVRTPNVDRLASEGVVFKTAYTSAPVSSASRSALITGMYQTSIGAQNHRSSKGTEKIYLPDGIKTIPELFKGAGYYTCSSTERSDRKGKEDYNFEYSYAALYNGTDWAKRADGQPFFAQVHLRGGKLRNVSKWYDEVVKGLDSSLLVKAKDVTLPPYYPEDPAFRKDWAEYLNSIQYTDKEVGDVIKRLEKENLLANTIIFFITDHGISQARGKQFLYDEGTKIPFVVWAPGKFKPAVRKDLINHIDMAATSLQLAGIEIPGYMDGRPLFCDNFVPRDFIVCARDRCDETVDHIRSIRKGNFKYIKNYLPERPYLQPCAYKDSKPWMPALRKLNDQGKLNKIQKLVTAQTRPEEELYNLSTDPFEIFNLASMNKYSKKLVEMRKILDQWVVKTGDKGKLLEPENIYESNMKVYLQEILRSGDKKQVEIIENNISLMKKWAKEGK